MEPASSRIATATTLFTGLVESTAKRARVAEERAEALQRLGELH